jgi:TrmH family RNA methyltransferase
MEPLASSNPKIKRLRRLTGRRSSRLEDRAFVIEGPTNVAEALRSGVDLDEVLADVNGCESVAAWATVPVVAVAAGVLQQVLSTEAPQPVCAIAAATLHRPVAEIRANATATGRPLLVLVDISDPGNAGTLMRSAEAAGSAGVVFAGNSVDPYNPKVVRSSAGSIFRLMFAVERELDEVLAALEGVAIWAAVGSGGSSHLDAPLGGALALLLGNEAHGLDPAVIDRCDARVTVDMDGSTESLNVAMAGTVLLFESMRQRRAAVDHNDAR